MIAQSCSLDPQCCPVKALVQLILCHWQHFVLNNIPFDGSVPLASFYFNNKCLQINPTEVTKHICQAARALFNDTGSDPLELTAQSLQTRGAMALLCAHYDTDQTKLSGQWHLDAMMQYLHQEVQPVLQQLAQKCLTVADTPF